MEGETEKGTRKTKREGNEKQETTVHVKTRRVGRKVATAASLRRLR